MMALPLDASTSKTGSEGSDGATTASTAGQDTATSAAGQNETPTPAPSAADQAREILSGLHKIVDLTEAAAILAGDAGEACVAAIEPVAGVLFVLELILDVLHAMETEQRGCAMRGWCYAVLYGALGLGDPPEPTFSGSLQGPDQDALDKQGWDTGVADGRKALANGNDGVSLGNKLLLRVSHDGNDRAATVTALWQASCAKSGDTALAKAYETLSWPQPTGA